MAGPRERSRNRRTGEQDEHEIQNLRTSHHHSPTAEGSNESYDDRYHGHPRKAGAQFLDGTVLAWKRKLTKPRMMTIYKAFAIFIAMVFAIWGAFYGFSHSDEPLNYGLAMGHLRNYPTTTHTVTHTLPPHIIKVTAEYFQFAGAKPVVHQEPVAVLPDVHATGQVTGQDLSPLHVVTATSSPVSGFYLLPMSGASGGWPQTQQDFDPSSRSASNTEGSQSLQGKPRLGNSDPESSLLLLQSRELGNPRNLLAGQADADTTSFTRWGLEVLYNLRRRSRDSIYLYKEWCIRNTCSPRKQLNAMCNGTENISGSFRKQECEWCWPEDQKKQHEIDSHCTEVSKRALIAISIICGIVCFCTLVIAIVLATRIVRRRRRAKADRKTIAPPLQEETNSVPSHWSSHRMSRFAEPSKTAKTRNDDIAIEKPSPGETVGQTPWYRSVFAKSGKRSGICAEDLAPGRLSSQKQRTKPLDQEIAIGDEDSHGRVPVLPPASPAISSQVFSDIKNMGQGRLLSISGTNNSQDDAQEMPRRSSTRSRAVSTSSEQSVSGATHRRDAGAGFYNLQRLTERS